MRHVALCLLTPSSDTRVTGSVLFFFLLSSLFSHPESCLNIDMLLEKSDVLGRPRVRVEGRNEKKKKKRKK